MRSGARRRHAPPILRQSEQQPALRVGRSDQATARFHRRAEAAGDARARTPGPHAKESRGDRQTQLDLVDAYTQLGNIQGNAYDQNLGDFNGALASLDKAIALVEPLTANGSMIVRLCTRLPSPRCLAAKFSSAQHACRKRLRPCRHRLRPTSASSRFRRHAGPVLPWGQRLRHSGRRVRTGRQRKPLRYSRRFEACRKTQLTNRALRIDPDFARPSGTGDCAIEDRRNRKR